MNLGSKTTLGYIVGALIAAVVNVATGDALAAGNGGLIGALLFFANGLEDQLDR